MAEPQPKSPEQALDPALAEVIDRLGAAIKANPKADQPDTDPPPAGKIVQLPLWPEPVRGTPNSFLRSALFAAIQGKGRKHLKRQLLASTQGGTLRFTGQQFDQSDLDVWEQAIHLAHYHPIGNVCYFTGYAFLKALGRNTGNAEYQWLDEAIERLVACAVIIQTGDQEYVGNLIGSCVRDKATRRYKLTLNPDTIKLYGWKDWTAIDREQRQALRGKPLALWLHGFYSTHAKPYPIKVETLRTLSGSGTKRLSKFKENLKSALRDLETVASIKSTIDGDLVIVERVPTRSQQRHLTRKSKQRAAIRTARKKPQNFQRLGDF